MIRELGRDYGPVLSYEIIGQASWVGTSKERAVRVAIGGQEIELIITADGSGQGWCRTSDGSSHRFILSWIGNDLHLWLDGYLFVYERVDSRRSGRQHRSNGGDDILAPMPGTVTEILVQVGDQVELGQTVIMMESMKMELLITANQTGVVLRLAVEPGSQVDKGMRLLEIEELLLEDKPRDD